MAFLRSLPLFCFTLRHSSKRLFLTFIQLEDWTAHSLLTNRIITVGRFTVTTKAKGKEAAQLASESDSDDGPIPKPKLIQPVKVPHKRKPILRKASFRRVDHGEENPDEAHRKKSLYPETAHRLEDLARRGLTGSTTILPGMKLKRSNSDSLTANSSHASLAREFFRAQGVDGSGRDSRDSKKVWFSTETQGSSDDHDDSDHEDGVFVSPLSHSASSDYPRTDWMLDENVPLIVSDSRPSSGGSSETATSSLEMDPRGLPEVLYEGLKNSPGTSLVDGRFLVHKRKEDAPTSLANIFCSEPDRTVDKTDGPSPPQSSQPQPDAVPSSLQNLFGPPPNHDKDLPSSSGVLSPPGKTPRPRVLPISPLARPESPPPARAQFPYLPGARISRSAPTSPDQERRWPTPITPSPEDAVSIPLASVTGRRAADFPLRKKSADLRVAGNTTAQDSVGQDSTQVAPVPLLPSETKKSGDMSSQNSRFAVKSNVQPPEGQTSTQYPVSPSQRKKTSGNSRFAVKTPAQASEGDNSDNKETSKPIDMPRSRVSPFPWIYLWDNLGFIL